MATVVDPSGPSNATESLAPLDPVKGVVDLTFLEIVDENSLVSALEEKIFGLDPFALRIPGSPSQKTRKLKRNGEIRAIRLSNNGIVDMKIIIGPSTRHFDLTNILWLDLSFNHIEKTSESFISVFLNLTSLYLHANGIKKLSDIKRLSKLLSLKSLTLYGNPVEENKHYKNYTLYYCANLGQFDSSPVTKSDRHRVRDCLLSSSLVNTHI